MNGKIWRACLALCLLLALGLLPNGVPAAAASPDHWVAQSSGTGLNLNAVVAVDASTAWAVAGQNGLNYFILKTTNGGTTWASPFYGNIGPELRGIAAVDASTLWAVGEAGVITKTGNGGTNWATQTSGTTATLFGVAAVDPSTAWVVGAGGVIRKTVDGGASWTAQTSGTGQNLNAVVAIDASTAYAVGGIGVMVKTVDGGASWTAQDISNGDHPLLGIAAVDASTLWAVGGFGLGGIILKTTNGGTNWTAQTSGTNNSLRSIAAVDANIAWAVGDGGTILNTINGGTTWTAQTSGTANNLFGVARVSSGIAWAVGASGTILKDTPVGGVGTSVFISSVSTQPANVCASINSPNPAAISYGGMALNTSKESPQITASNCGNAAETFLLQGANATVVVTGDTAWTLADGPGANIYSHAFATTSGGSFTPLTTTPAQWVTGIAVEGTSSFFLRITTPTSTTGNGARNSTVTLTATAP